MATEAEKVWRDISIDWDGVCNMYDGKWNGIHEPWEIRKGLREFLEHLVKEGWRITILSARHGVHLREVEDLLALHDLGHLVYEVTNVKKPCKVYVDDRGITFNGNFSDLITSIASFTAHWEQSNV